MPIIKYRELEIPIRDIHWTYKISDGLHAAEAGVDFAENSADDWSEDHQSRNNNDGYQNENQRIFNKTLTFFLGWK